MAENARPPVAVRIVRPYDTEEAFLESELETVGKTSVILIGAHARPQGVILRFEVTLQNGTVVLRGEGRVLQHKESAFRGQPGLALRFTRLDPKSKALVDRAGMIREARLAGSMPPPLPASPSQPEPTPPAPTSSDPIPAPSSVELSSTDLEPISSPNVEAFASAQPTTPPATLPTSPPTSPPTAPPPPESEPPDAATRKPPPLAATSAPPGDRSDPLAALPSFAPLAIPTNLPLVHANATIAPDAELAAVLTAPTPPPPPLAPSLASQSSGDEAKTRPGKRAELQPLLEPTPEPAPEPQESPAPTEELSASTSVHKTTTVAAPPLETPPTDSALTRVADRDALLARLRERKAGMSADRERATRAKRE